jgi:hypothetical protein
MTWSLPTQLLYFLLSISSPFLSTFEFLFLKHVPSFTFHCRSCSVSSAWILCHPIFLQVVGFSSLCLSLFLIFTLNLFWFLVVLEVGPHVARQALEPQSQFFFVLVYFSDRVSHFCLGWPKIKVLLFSPSPGAWITGVNCHSQVYTTIPSLVFFFFLRYCLFLFFLASLRLQSSYLYSPCTTMPDPQTQCFSSLLRSGEVPKTG